MAYSVIRCDRKAHIIRDNATGIISGAIFEELDGEDSLSGIEASSPCMVMMSLEGPVMTLSVSNPDLGLYTGPSDEILDGNGKRTERSIYGREWVDNPCGNTAIDMTLTGKWKLEDAGDSTVTVLVEGDSTRLHFTTKGARTEEIRLSRIIGE